MQNRVPENSAPRQQLEDAFLVFNQVSEQLTDSYRQLQARTDALSRELAAARTERMLQLAEKERLANRLSQLLDALPAAVVVLTGNRRIQQINPAAQGFFPGIVIGDCWDSFVDAHIRDREKEGEFILDSGRQVTLTECSLSPEPGQILLFVDITETRALQNRIERQKRLSAMGEMAAQLAHQIRTPLSSAMIYNGHLSRDDLSHEQRIRFSERCQKRLKHIERQISDMLVFARGGGFDPEPIQFSRLVEELGQTLQPMLSERNADFRWEDRTPDGGWVNGNHDSLLGALLNLATNSLDHGGAEISLKLRMEQRGQQLLITFSDNGPGIPEDLTEQIFDPFFTTRSDGTGLGLAVVQSVILGHQGSINLRRSETGSACFLINLPRLSERKSDDRTRREAMEPALSSNLVRKSA